MLKCIMVACIVCLTTIAASPPGFSQPDYGQNTGSLALEPASATLSFENGGVQSRVKDGSSDINWGMYVTEACAAVGALSMFSSSGSGSGGGIDTNLAGVKIEIPAGLDTSGAGQEDEAVVAVATPAVPDAPCALLVLMGLPGIVRFAYRNRK